MDDRGGRAKTVGRAVGWLLSLAALVFLVRWVSGLERSVWDTLGQLKLGWLALSILLFIPFYAWRASAWELISQQAGYKQHRWVNWRMWALSELARYIPGNIWSLAVRYQGARQGGVSRRQSLQSLLIEAAALVAGASLVSAITLPFGPYKLLAGVVAAGTLTFLVFGPGLLQRWKPDPEGQTPPHPWPLLWRYFLAWVFYGAATAALWFAFPDHSSMSWWQVFGSNVAAWVVGYLSFVTPMGLGVREVAFVALVPTAVGAPLAGLLAIITRLMMAGTELLFAGALTMIGRPRS